MTPARRPFSEGRLIYAPARLLPAAGQLYSL